MMRKYTAQFVDALARPGSAAQETLVKAMVEWWMATDRNEALAQINAHPGSDLAGIENSVVSGLTEAANILVCSLEDLISERDLTPLAKLTPFEILSILDSIHTQWIEDNFSARRWAEKYFKGQLFQYRATSNLPWKEVAKDLLFIQEYLTAAGCTVTEEDLKEAFALEVAALKGDQDLHETALRAVALADDIIPAIIAFREKSAKKPELVAKIDAFLALHPDPVEIMGIMVKSI